MDIESLITDIYTKLDYIATHIDHNKQHWIDLQDKLNKYSVQE